jgi:membrane protease YdiL (CAAX protease family)
MIERPFKLPLYLLIVFGLSWPFLIVSALGPATLAWSCLFNCLAMIMVGVGTFICGRYVFRDGFAEAGWRWGVRRYWLAAIGIPALLWIVPAILDLAFGNLHIPKTLTASQIGWLFQLLVVVLIPAFGEEIGWRGYLLPRLVRAMSPMKAVVCHGVIWYLWHAPLVGYCLFVVMRKESPESWWAASLAAMAAALAFGCVLGVFNSAIYARLWAGSQSIVIATVLHSAGDGFRDSLSITVGSGPIGQIWTPLLMILIGAYILWRTNWGRVLGACLPAPGTAFHGWATSPRE